MKKYITIFLFFFYSLGYGQAPTLAVRNSILGLYSGTYWDYYHNQPVVPAGAKIIALPNDTAGVIIHDTINNVIDTMSIGFFYDMTHTFVVDTVLLDKYGNDYGDIISANDSIFFAHITSENFPNPVGEFQLLCTHHTIPTSINEKPIDGVRIFPNPALDILNVTIEGIGNYTIYNNIGELIKSVYGSNLCGIIDIHELQAGIYYINIQSEKCEVIKMFIKY